jgi:hypothetical protein
VSPLTKGFRFFRVERAEELYDVICRVERAPPGRAPSRSLGWDSLTLHCMQSRIRRSVSAVQPIFEASETIASHCDARSP